MMIPFFSLDSFCNKHLAKDLKEVISSSIYGNGITLRCDRIRIDVDIINNLFKPTVDKIINLMKHGFADYNVNEVVMVGGFSLCSLVQDAVRQTFSNKNIIIPKDADVAVMKGAVLCGHQPCKYIQLTSSEVGC